MISKGETPALLSTTYFGPIGYYSKMLLHKEIFIEQFENFTRQTYRNRCEILGANGIIPLIVPVVKGRGSKMPVKDILISYDTDWQRNHWRTIFSAYNSSPYFCYYKDDLMHFFNKRWKYLFELNMAINECVCDLIEIEPDIKLTDAFEAVPPACVNLRAAFTPKKHKKSDDNYFSAKEYTQVFSEKFGFISNLSILDLLFNEGPGSYNILSSSIINCQAH
jgi:hypothetical protein